MAQTCARIIAEESIVDYRDAIRKAASRLGTRGKLDLPSPEEIDDALEQHYRLFRPGREQQLRSTLDRITGEALRFFAEYSPRRGNTRSDFSAAKFAKVNLELFPNNPDDVAAKLRENHIPFVQFRIDLPLGRSKSAPCQGIKFLVDGTPVEMLLIPAKLRLAIPCRPPRVKPDR
jgi:hypothetical protein